MRPCTCWRAKSSFTSTATSSGSGRLASPWPPAACRMRSWSSQRRHACSSWRYQAAARRSTVVRASPRPRRPARWTLGASQPQPSAMEASRFSGRPHSRRHKVVSGLSTKTGKSNRWLRQALIEAANAAARSKDTFLGAYYQRLRGRMGHKKTLVALAHRILIIIYHLLKEHQSYREMTDQFEVVIIGGGQGGLTL